MYAKTPALAGVLIWTVGLLSGCATPQVADLLRRPAQDLPVRIELAAVPFFAQEEYQCGPASLAAALTYAGRDATPEQLQSQVYIPARRGSLQAEMLGAVRRQGLLAYVLAPQLEDLLRELAAGTPVLVLQNLAFDWHPVWHYAVAIGYDLEREEIVLRSGTTRRLAVTLSNFERTWARSRYWAMLALPPGRLPASAGEAAYVSAAVPLERVAPQSALEAYAAALARWPGNLVARMGLGNAAYALRDLAAAEAAYRQATVDHPQAADAWNNLAQTLLDRGRKAEALAAARRAIELGGPRLPEYEATLNSIPLAR